VYLAPDGERVARTAPFDPAYALHVRGLRAHPEQRHFQRVEEVSELAPAGQLVVMERLQPPDEALATELCCRLGETRCLGRPPSDRELLGFADARQRSPELRGLFDLLRATAREGARTLAFWGGLDVRPGNVMQDERGLHKLIDPYFVAGRALIPAILSDVGRVARHYALAELRGFLEISVFEPEENDPGPVLRQLRERVSRLEACTR